MRGTEGNAVGTRKRQGRPSGRWKTDGKLDAQNSNKGLWYLKVCFMYQLFKSTCLEYRGTVLAQKEAAVDTNVVLL